MLAIHTLSPRRHSVLLEVGPELLVFGAALRLSGARRLGAAVHLQEVDVRAQDEPAELRSWD